MQPSIWYTVDLKLVESRRGNLNLLFQDYKFSEVKVRTNAIKPRKIINDSDQKTTWRCSRRDKNCSARITTRGHNQLKIGPTPHNHLPAVGRGRDIKPLIRLPEHFEHQPVDIKDVVKLE